MQSELAAEPSPAGWSSTVALLVGEGVIAALLAVVVVASVRLEGRVARRAEAMEERMAECVEVSENVGSSARWPSKTQS